MHYARMASLKVILAKQKNPSPALAHKKLIAKQL